MPPVDTDMFNISVGQASIEARLMTISAQLLDANKREDERLFEMARRMDDRHNALVDRLEERQENHERFQEQMLECLKDIRDTLKPLEKRIDDLEATKSKMVGVATAISGGTVTLGGLVAWLIDFLGKNH